MERDVLTREDLAAEFGVKVETITSYLSRRPEKLPPHRRIGGRIVWLRADLAAWLAALPKFRSAAEANSARRMNAHRRQGAVLPTPDRRKGAA